MLQIEPIPAFQDNYIWCLRRGSRAAFVDPGDAAPVVRAIENNALEPCAIIVTHHHWDHVGGIEELLQHFDIPVFGPAAENIPGCTQALAEGDTITVPGLDLDLIVMEVPGHTSGHIAYYGQSDGVLLCGDTLFSVGCGRLFEGTPAQMWQSLQKLRALPDDTRVYCSHEYTQANCEFALRVEPDNAALGERMDEVLRLRANRQPTVPSSIGRERMTNPFLRSDVPSVMESAARRAGRTLNDPTEVFAVVRGWKDVA